jgi:hypothetical protein
VAPIANVLLVSGIVIFPPSANSTFPKPLFWSCQEKEIGRLPNLLDNSEIGYGVA